MSLQGAATKGNPGAKVALLEYSDFECPFCGKFVTDTLGRLEETYVSTGKVLLAYRHLPLEAIHKQAFGAAEAAECAGAQGKFWAMHDIFFKGRPALDRQSIDGYAERIGLDKARFSGCIRSGGAAGQVRSDLATAKTLGLTGTPSFFIGVLRGTTLQVKAALVGAQPFDNFRLELEKLLR